MNEHGTTSMRRRRDDGSRERALADGTWVPLPSKTDWAGLAAMTEAEIEANAGSDPDNPLLGEEELARLRPIPDAKAIRLRLDMTQEQFARSFQLPLETVREWEAGARSLTGSARTLLRVIERNPDAVLEALNADERDRLAG